MARGTTLLQAFNRGIISPLALARVDVDRTSLSAETQRNFVPRALGSMTLRTGTQYLGTTLSNNEARQIPFYFSIGEQNELEFTSGNMRVWDDESLVQTGTSTATVDDGSFANALSDPAEWEDDSESAGSAATSGGYLKLSGSGIDEGRAYQEISIPSGEEGTDLTFKVVVARGPVVLRIGSGAANDSSITETTLGTGTHVLTVTAPTGSVFITFAKREAVEVWVEEVSIFASATDITLPTPYSESDLANIRYAQSADVIYLACEGFQQRKIERRGEKSWSIITYQPQDGPFRRINTTEITMAPSDVSGVGHTLTSSKDFFVSGHVGSLFRLESQGQEVTQLISGEDQWTEAIRVTGVDAGRVFIEITNDDPAQSPNNWDATRVKIQRSVESALGPWEDTGFTPTTRGAQGNGEEASVNRDDGFDNQIIWYRAGVDIGEFNTYNVRVTLLYGGGTSEGVARVTAINSTTEAQIDILEDFGGTDATKLWYEGEWSGKYGYPSAVSIYEGRLWWFGKNKIIGSESDNYELFSPTTEGDSALINRTIGSGPVEQIAWALPLQRLIVGTPSSEISLRATSFDEPLTGTDFNQKDASTMGSAFVEAVKMDANGVYIQRSGQRLMLLDYALSNNDYTSGDLTQLNPDLLRGGVRRLAVQRMPDNRIHIVMNDGRVMLLLIDTAEDIRAFVELDFGDGLVEDVVVQPATEEDHVYYVIKRTIDGSTVRYREKVSFESECIGGDVSKNLDCHVEYTAAGASTLTGLDHLEGESVLCWADGVLLEAADFPNSNNVVTGGQVDVGVTVQNAVVGLSYDALYKSSKLAYLSQTGSALNKRKTIDRLGLVMANTLHKAITYGSRSEDEYDMPEVEQGQDVDDDYVWDHYDFPMFDFPSAHEADARLYIKGGGGKPVTILAISMDQETRD